MVGPILSIAMRRLLLASEPCEECSQRTEGSFTALAVFILFCERGHFRLREVHEISIADAHAFASCSSFQNDYKSVDADDEDPRYRNPRRAAGRVR
jgi:hypothetical protein